VSGDPRMMVAETLLSSVQFAGLKSHFSNMQAGYFNYPPASVGPPRPPACVTGPDGYPVSPLELPSSLHGDMFNQRKQREFIPDNKKDESYWDRRRRNNEAAKRSREKRRLTDMVLESRVFDLTKENHLMRAQLAAIRDKFGIVGENLINREQVLSQLPAMDQILSLNKRNKTTPPNSPHMMPQLPAGAGFATGALSPPMPQFRAASPQQAPPPALLFRQQSMRELRRPDTEEEMTAQDYSRPRSAEPEQRPYPVLPAMHPLAAAVNLSGKPAMVLPAVSVVAEVRPSVTSPGGEAGSALPLKLRHKTLLCEREAAAASLLQMAFKSSVKEEPQDSPAGSEASSGDERDSGLSDRSASSDGGADEPARKRARSEVDDSETAAATSPAPAPASGLIRCELERLAKEVASLKSLLNHREASPPPREA